MGAVPERCTTCGTAIPAGSVRCIACGKVYGDDNLCPHCHATAGVLARAGGYACAACGRPRDKKPGTVVLGEGAGAGPAGRGRAVVHRGASAGLRTVGAMSIGVGVVVAALAAMLVPGAAGIVLAVLAGGAGVGAGALALRAGARQSAEADRRERADRERRILDLAEASHGDLTVTETARALGVPMDEADRMLTEMADGSRVSVEVDPDGILHYVFRELRLEPPAARRVRVGDERAEQAAEPVEEQAAAPERERRHRD